MILDVFPRYFIQIIDKKNKIVTHCSAGYRGNIACEELNKLGFQALNLEGGFEAWNKLKIM